MPSVLIPYIFDFYTFHLSTSNVFMPNIPVLSLLSTWLFFSSFTIRLASVNHICFLLSFFMHSVFLNPVSRCRILGFVSYDHCLSECLVIVSLFNFYEELPSYYSVYIFLFGILMLIFPVLPLISTLLFITLNTTGAGACLPLHLFVILLQARCVCHT